MTVKLKLVNGNYEIFKTESYVVSKIKDLHPDILDCKVYADNGRLLIRRRRLFQRFYKKYQYKPLPPETTRTPNADPKADNEQ